MIKFAQGVILSLLLASPASASLIRVEVTGSAIGLVGYERADDLTAPDGGSSSAGGTFDFRDLPLGILLDTMGSDLVETVISSTGSFLYSTSDQSFSECSGLLKRVCFFNGDSVWFPNPPVFDAVLDTFSMTVAFVCCAGFDMTPTSFSYGDDRDVVFRLENVVYYPAYPLITGTLDTMTVTVVPGPAALPLMLSALGALAFWRRRVT